MSDMSFDDAAAALSSASNTPEPGQAAGEQTPIGTSEATPVTPEGSQSQEGTTGTPDSFTQADLGTLLNGVTDPVARERIETAYKSFQGDYTRKSQEVAEQAKLYEGLDPARARESVQFVEALETNPEFALKVHEALTSNLIQQGFSPAEAAQAAANAIEDSSLGGEDDEPVSALAKEVQDLRQWKEGFEQDQREQQLAAHIQRQELSIRQANPDLTDEDVTDIYGLAWSFGGDLDQAHKAYQAINQRVVSRYVDSKSEVPPGVPAATGHAEVPAEAPTSMADADRRALEYLEQSLAN